MTDNTAFLIRKQRSNPSSREPIEQWQSQAGGHSRVSSLYIHIPFCFHKCHYCDFYSIVDRSDRQEAFVDRMISELDAQAQAIEHPVLDTIFIGGGTPTLLKPALLERLLGAIKTRFKLQPTLEWTIESNPETLTDDICKALAGSCINRISMGAQSFNPIHLKSLERHHDPASVERSIDRAREFGFHQLSLDLIYGVPGQTLRQWADDLQRALQLPIDHLSAYALTYEPNTAMTARLNRGEFRAAPDELEVNMYNLTLDRITEHGMDRYEVSNYAKPGSQCEHNLAYWAGKNWLAVGPSASGHLDGYRWKNTPRLDEYLNNSDCGFSPICEFETPDPRTMLKDRLMMGIRVSSGLERESVKQDACRLNRGDELERVMNQCVDVGWVESVDKHWKLTDSGFHYADRVARELIGTLIDD